MARKRRMPPEGQEHNFWQSYSDMMAGLLLTFILIISGALLMLMGVKNSYDESELALAEREAQLELEIAEKLSYADLSELQQAQLDEQAEQLAIQAAQLAEQQTQLEAQQTELSLSQALLIIQQNQLATQQQELEDVIGVKRQIVAALSEEFSGSDLKISLDEQTGAITMDSSVLFDLDSSTLASEGRSALEEFLPMYFRVVLSEEYLPYISEIIIEGHTDTAGTYMYNLGLSQSRAQAVASFCLAEDQALFDEATLETIRSLVTVSGKSWSDPIYNDDGTVNADLSRRVEVKFRLSDEEMINRMLEILEAYEEEGAISVESSPAP